MPEQVCSFTTDSVDLEKQDSFALPFECFETLWMGIRKSKRSSLKSMARFLVFQAATARIRTASFEF